MDSWPIDYRTPVAPLGRGKRRAEEPQSSCNYLDVKLGSLNAVNLFEKEHRLEWTSVLKHTLQKGSSSRRRTITIFPPTRPPRLCAPQTTIFQRAKQGANFLHTYLPDIDIPAELIRDEITRDAEIERKFGPFDPYVGSLLEYVPCDSKTAFLAFPMGELARDLNLSSINYSEQHEVSFSPNASPVLSFKTPIQQIVSTKDMPDYSELNSYLVVRTFEMTSVMKVMASDTSTQSTQVAELASIVQTDTIDRPIVDMRLATRPLKALTITDTGALYKFSFADGKKDVSVVRPAASDTEPITDMFWRIALGENGVDCFVASSKDVKLQDIRSRTSFDLFTVPGQQDVLTSVDYGGDNILRVCSTRDIVWIDKRYPNRPLLGCKHGRKYDRSLEARSVQFQSQSTLLTSRNNALVTVYDVSRSAERLTHMTKPPYCLFPDKSVGASCIGSVSFQHPHSSNENAYLIRLSDEGSLHYVDLTTPLNEDAAIKTLWSADVKDLDARMQNLRPDVGPLGAHDFTEIDFRPAYEAIFRTHQETQTEEETGEAVYDLLDQMPHFWQTLDPPVEHMLTFFDTVFRSGPQPIQASRADFLTQSIINSKRGYRALLQDRLSPRCLTKDASWHYNISSTVKRLGLDFTGDIRSYTEALHRYDLIPDPERDARSVRWENDAREQLAVDLALSGDVFSDRPFSTYPHGSSELEAMTETLSLASKPPSVNFGYLRPVLKSTVDHYQMAEDNEVVFSSGVRALLKDWVIGTDPQIPSRKDDSHYTTRSNSGTLPLVDQAVQSPALSSSKRPPPIVASTADLPTQPDILRRGFSMDDFRAPRVPLRGFGIESQRVLNVPEALDSSQDYMMNTQILPGPYGGRPLLKKKMAKKRLGGF